MRETARPEVKRRRRFKPAAAVIAVPAAPEPLVADKYYAGEITCRMVELGIEVPGCKGKFRPRGNELACSPACRDKLDRYHNKVSEKKNRPKHRAATNARETGNYTEKRKALERPCQGPRYPKTVGGPRCGGKVPYKKHSKMLYCSDDCADNAQYEKLKAKRQQQPKIIKPRTCEAPHPTRPGELCGKEFRRQGNSRQIYCSKKCRRRARLIADNAARRAKTAKKKKTTKG
jgi:hypothetical protein